MTTRVIILNWNGRAWLPRCLSALFRQTRLPDEVVVVDNGSTDDSVAYLQKTWPSVRVLSLHTNGGFALGNNRGAAGATTDALVFLNNDTEVEPGWLEALVQAATADVARGLVASRIVFLDHPEVIDSAGDGYLRVGGGFKHGHGQPVDTFLSEGEVFAACGAAFLIRRPLFETLGGFDESFFMVYEDVDLSYRARLRGTCVWYAADAVVKHAGSGSMGRISDLAVFCGQRNLEWVWWKNTPARLWWRSLPAHVAYNVAGGLAYARRGRLWPWLRGKAAALAGLPRIWRVRRTVQATRCVQDAALWALMDADWIRRKRREKQFSFQSDPTAERHGAPDR